MEEKLDEEKQYPNQRNIITNFEKLFEKLFQEAHYPKYYAERLAITANYLNLVCKNYVGKTAGELIRGLSRYGFAYSPKYIAQNQLEQILNSDHERCGIIRF